MYYTGDQNIQKSYLDQSQLFEEMAAKSVTSQNNQAIKMLRSIDNNEILNQGGIEKFEVAKPQHKQTERCISSHKHARNSTKIKETDLSDIQSKAFRYMVLEKPKEEPTGFVKGELWRPSFFPKSKIPEELKNYIDVKRQLKQQVNIPDKVLKSRPSTTPKSLSRFPQKMPQPTMFAPDTKIVIVENDKIQTIDQAINDQQLQEYLYQDNFSSQQDEKFKIINNADLEERTVSTVERIDEQNSQNVQQQVRHSSEYNIGGEFDQMRPTSVDGYNNNEENPTNPSVKTENNSTFKPSQSNQKKTVDLKVESSQDTDDQQRLASRLATPSVDSGGNKQIVYQRAPKEIQFSGQQQAPTNETQFEQQVVNAVVQEPDQQIEDQVQQEIETYAPQEYEYENDIHDTEMEQFNAQHQANFNSESVDTERVEAIFGEGKNSIMQQKYAHSKKNKLKVLQEDMKYVNSNVNKLLLAKIQSTRCDAVQKFMQTKTTLKPRNISSSSHWVSPFANMSQASKRSKEIVTLRQAKTLNKSFSSLNYQIRQPTASRNKTHNFITIN